MINVFIVDNDQDAIRHIIEMLEKHDRFNVIATYSDVETPLKKLANIKPDIVFTTIEIDGINGIDFTKKIKAIDSNIEVVFVTNNIEYALDSYAVDALDYIKKPIKSDDIESVIDRYNNRKDVEQNDNVQMICCFNYFSFRENGKEVRNIKWRTAKTKELLIYLIQNRNEVVRKDVIVELLWADSGIENAYSQLYSSIYHLRKMLKTLDFNLEIISTDNGYELEFNNIIVDVDVWEKELSAMRRIDNNNIIDYTEALELYKGDYLGDETFIWQENERERLRVLYFYYTENLINYLIKEESNYEAILIALNVQKFYPYLEDSYYWLMQLYERLGNTYSVVDQYNKLTYMLQEEFNSKPRSHIQEWYDNWSAETNLEEKIK